nr:hypothetical protein [Tanacetum cinerariifolium]
MAFISSAKHSRGNEDVTTASVSTASTNVPTTSTNVGVSSISQDTACAYIASQSSGSQIKFKDINQIDEDDMEEMDIKWNMALLSMRADRAPRSQDRERRDNYRQGSKVEEHAPKVLMEIDGVGWDWSYIENDEENHALVVEREAPTEFALMANTKTLKKEKERLDGKLVGFQTAFKDLDSLLESQRLNKNKEGLGYSVVPPPPVNSILLLKRICLELVSLSSRMILKRVKKGTSRSQNNTHRSFTPRPAVHKPYRPPMRPMRS